METFSLVSFNPTPSSIMHIDLNSCFATVEQQANPLLRGKPIAVCAYTTPSGCILAPSVEAKNYGVKTGMRVRDGKKLCPDLIALNCDPPKYRHVHKALAAILEDYTYDYSPKSIDEFVLNLSGFPAIKRGIFEVGNEIKKRIRQEVGDWMRVSIGIAPNRFLAKTASSLYKPDGLNEINKDNFLQVYSFLGLTDLCGINYRNERRLNKVGIHTVLDFYNSDVHRLKIAFSSILGYYWYLRLRGWEIDAINFSRRSFGNSYALPTHSGSKSDLLPILQKLVEKTGTRLRRAGYKTKGVHLSLNFKNGGYWHKGKKLKRVIFDSRDIYQEMARLLSECPFNLPVRVLAETCFYLTTENVIQDEIFTDVLKKQSLVTSIDDINEVWGDFTVVPARMLGSVGHVHDRIAFGNVTELY